MENIENKLDYNQHPVVLSVKQCAAAEIGCYIENLNVVEKDGRYILSYELYFQNKKDELIKVCLELKDGDCYRIITVDGGWKYIEDDRRISSIQMIEMLIRDYIPIVKEHMGLGLDPIQKAFNDGQTPASIYRIAERLLDEEEFGVRSMIRDWIRQLVLSGKVKEGFASIDLAVSVRVNVGNGDSYAMTTEDACSTGLGKKPDSDEDL